jgi:hypothetical protein
MLSGAMLSTAAWSQTPTQTVRGKVIDAALKTGIPGANVLVMNTDPPAGAVTADDGSFEIRKVPVGRVSLKISFMGYQTSVIPEILVTSGKEVFVNAELSESAISAREVEVKATVDKDKPVNAMALISARSFNVEESRRYAGSADDPMRAVSNFAGVASSADVNSNQIVIRGNSPKGLLWRIDGVDVPNPNHYAYVGNSGGGLTMFSSQVLGNSDFYTAAFPSQFGNAISGVFDMRFRNGNPNRHEFAFQLGIQGLDVSAEGPVSRKNNSSYLFNYRYSILAFLQLIDPAMKNKIPSYQDLSFKVLLPGGKAGTFSIFGIGGISRSRYTPEADSSQWNTLEDRTQSVLNNNMAAIALSHDIPLSRSVLVHSYIAGSYSDIYYDCSLLDSAYTPSPEQYAYHRNYRLMAGSSVRSKFGKRHTNKTGFAYSDIHYDLDVRARNPFSGIVEQVDQGTGNTGLFQAYSESKIDLGVKLTLSGGLFFQYFLLNRRYSVEPRIALRWQAFPKHAFSVGYGKHSQLEDIGLYLADVASPGEVITKPNRLLDFSKARHFVLGYDYSIRPDMRFKAEAYLQLLYSIPVKPGSYYSLINSQGAYVNDSLTADGKGRNIGLDLTLEKFLTRKYYFLVTLSLFDSRYTGGDGLIRNTRFNANYVANLLGGKEWTVRKKNLFGINLKASYTGGEYYVPIDLEASVAQHREVLDEAAAYTQRLPDFLYLDLTLTYRTNHRKFSGTWAIQAKNLLNMKPVTGYVYNDFNHSIEAVQSSGIIPFISYKVEF